jgi:predicted NBD/HSP70 family sugar kinase
VGEARRGAARGAHTHLHLVLEIGMGGAVTSHGTALEGSRGAAGEFGHLPFGDPGLDCPCGATGCWGKTLDGSALARALGRPDPEDAAAYSGSVLDLAEGGDAGALAAVAVQAASLGRGTAGLVNALDPALVTLGGLAARLLMVAPAVTHDAYRRGLMSHRRERPPELVPGALGDDAPLVGAAEQVWDRLLADGLGGWPPVG